MNGVIELFGITWIVSTTVYAVHLSPQGLEYSRIGAPLIIEYVGHIVFDGREGMNLVFFRHSGDSLFPMWGTDAMNLYMAFARSRTEEQCDT